MPFQPKGVEYLFVYGTLMLEPAVERRVQPPMVQFLTDNATLIEEASVAGRLYHMGAYPGLVLGDRQIQRVHGEVVQLTGAVDAIWEKLDAHEDCAPDNGPEGEYSRVKAQARLRSGGHVDAWTYVYNRDVSQRTPIPDGRWRG